MNKERSPISLEQDFDQQLTLTVKDDGRGLPKGLDLINGKSLGLPNLNGLATQLGGELSWIEQSRGARYVSVSAGITLCQLATSRREVVRSHLAGSFEQARRMSAVGDKVAPVSAG